jgi:DNA-binding transcriptional LysR family regulator
MDVHIRDLRYFLAVAEELHFTRAAQGLFVTQPALSKQIRQLEQQLGTALFARGSGGRSVSLTATGWALLPVARRVVATWEEGQHAVIESARGSTKTIVVNLSVTLGRGLLPAIRRVFDERQGDWRLALQQVSFDVGVNDVRAGSADAAFSWMPVVPADGLSWAILFGEPRMVALPVGHRLAEREEIAFEELLDEPFLALPEATGEKRSFWLAEELRGGHPVKVGAVVHGPEDTLEALAQGTGIALITAGNAALYRQPWFVCRPVSGVGPAQLAVVWRTTDTRPVMKDFVRCCVEAASAVLGPA